MDLGRDFIEENLVKRNYVEFKVEDLDAFIKELPLLYKDRIKDLICFYHVGKALS